MISCFFMGKSVNTLIVTSTLHFCKFILLNKRKNGKVVTILIVFLISNRKQKIYFSSGCVCKKYCNVLGTPFATY